MNFIPVGGIIAKAGAIGRGLADAAGAAGRLGGAVTAIAGRVTGAIGRLGGRISSALDFEGREIASRLEDHLQGALDDFAKYGLTPRQTAAAAADKRLPLYSEASGSTGLLTYERVRILT